MWICPFGLWSWVVQNASLFKVRINRHTCIECGKCVASVQPMPPKIFMRKDAQSRLFFLCTLSYGLPDWLAAIRKRQAAFLDQSNDAVLWKERNQERSAFHEDRDTGKKKSAKAVVFDR
jgi:hypothetical protein